MWAVDHTNAKGETKRYLFLREENARKFKEGLEANNAFKDSLAKGQFPSAVKEVSADSQRGWEVWDD